jgi:ribosomal-protein-alanine N-acetyltransferase
VSAQAAVDRSRPVVRPACPGDAVRIERAERTCFADPWPGHLITSELLAPGRFHRLVEDPAGGLSAYLLSTWQYLDLHVLKVATLPHCRRRGLASRLMRMAEAHAAEMGGETVTLEVRVSNVVAASMYRCLGYEVFGRRPGYYADGEEALIMTRRVNAVGGGAREGWR